jgi:hypothetical protein
MENQACIKPLTNPTAIHGTILRSSVVSRDRCTVPTRVRDGLTQEAPVFVRIHKSWPRSVARTQTRSTVPPNLIRAAPATTNNCVTTVTSITAVAARPTPILVVLTGPCDSHRWQFTDQVSDLI